MIVFELDQGEVDRSAFAKSHYNVSEFFPPFKS